MKKLLLAIVKIVCGVFLILFGVVASVAGLIVRTAKAFRKAIGRKTIGRKAKA